MKIFISGGCKNGKSGYGQRLAKSMENENGLYYIATMISSDKEDEERIRLHRLDRLNMGFETLEIKSDILKNLEIYSNKASYLLDSTTALLSNEMFGNGEINENIYLKIVDDFNKILSTFENIVIVSDYIYSDAMDYDKYTNKYIKSLGTIDRAIVKSCDVVIEVTFGNTIVHKGKELLKELDCEFN